MTDHPARQEIARIVRPFQPTARGAPGVVRDGISDREAQAILLRMEALLDPQDRGLDTTRRIARYRKASTHLSISPVEGVAATDKLSLVHRGTGTSTHRRIGCSRRFSQGTCLLLPLAGSPRQAAAKGP